MAGLTSQQSAAVEAKGSVLLMAGAGTGKTSTLVARVLHWLFDGNNRGSLDRLLMVTFTEAAAAEMRERIRSALWKRCHQPEHQEHAQAQLTLLDTAHIRTLHSFNLELIRQHFLELEIDPRSSVLEPQQARLLQEEVLEELWDDYFDPQKSPSPKVRDWLKKLGTNAISKVNRRLLALHEQWRTQADPQAWLDRQRGSLHDPEPTDWHHKLLAAFNHWASHWRQYIQLLDDTFYIQEKKIKPETIAFAQSFADLLPESFSSLEQVIQCLRDIHQRNDEGWPRGQKTVGGKPLERFFGEVKKFLPYLYEEGTNPLKEDWTWVRQDMGILLDLLCEFDERYTRAKRQQGVLDFNDFEQLALRLLYEPDRKNTSAIAEQWRQRFEQVLVDEYQDINPAQDAILRALSREGDQANRFLVGDVKQSIYRFRQAAPGIFQNYASDWRQTPHCQVLPLSENFRSAEAILDFVNSLFTGLMIKEVGGVHYDEEAFLRYGAPSDRPFLRRSNDSTDCRRVELHLVASEIGNEASDVIEGAVSEESEGDEEGVSVDKLRAEARLVARRLWELKRNRFPVWRRHENRFTEVQWSDMVVLLRAPKGRAEVFAREFADVGIPLRTETDKLLESREVQDLLNLLRLLDNPLQDLPLASVLRSPWVGLKLDDLADIRLARKKGSLWLALHKWLEETQQNFETDSPQARVKHFLDNYRRWRHLARSGSLVTCLEVILKDTFYDVWCQAQPDGAQRHAHVQQFLHMARHFDHLQRQGLHRFLQLVETLTDLELSAETPKAVTENCVRLLSIHQSKGLEFPVVVLAGMANQLNFSDSQSDILWEDALGLCMRVYPQGRFHYPSLLHLLADHRLKKESVGEELRLLYVALTRACDLLLLTGHFSEKKWNQWVNLAALPPTPMKVLEAKGALDWVGAWCLNQSAPFNLEQRTGQNEHLRWQIHSAQELINWKPPLPETTQENLFPEDHIKAWEHLWAWQYPHLAATKEAAKTHVSALRRRIAYADEQAAEAGTLLQARTPVLPPTCASLADQSRGMRAGALHHLFLERLDLGIEPTPQNFRGEAQRLVQEGVLLQEEIEQLNCERLAQFWNSDVGRAIRSCASQAHREIPFTARFTPADLRRVGVPVQPDLRDEEFMVVQGVADLVVLLEQELWVLDYKTDHIDPEKVAERAAFYAPQVYLYGLALGRIYRRPACKLWLHFLAPGVTHELPPLP